MIKLYIKKGIASVLALLTLATCLSMGSVAFAEDLVAINEQNFPDNAFRGYITDECDLDGNGYLSVSEISSVKSMWLDAFIENEQVSNLDGIDKFYNLEKLYCADLGLTSLDISKNPKLNTVRASGNNLKTITIGSLPNLTVFDCSENGITSLDVSGCPQLSDLKANINKIATLDAIWMPLNIFVLTVLLTFMFAFVELIKNYNAAASEIVTNYFVSNTDKLYEQTARLLEFNFKESIIFYGMFSVIILITGVALYVLGKNRRMNIANKISFYEDIILIIEKENNYKVKR